MGRGRRLGLVDQTVVNRVQREFEAVGNAQLVEDVVQVILDGLLADEEFFADFLVPEALGHELDDFLFSVAEERLLPSRAGLGGFRERFHDLGGHAVVEPDFAGVNAVNAFHEQVRGGLFEDDAAGSEPHGANDVAIVFSSRQDDDAGRQRIEINFLENRESVFIRHAEIKQKDLGLELSEKLNALRAILGFADDGDVFVGIKEFAEAVAKDRVVVREKDTNLLFSFGHVNRAGLRWSVALHGQG